MKSEKAKNKCREITVFVDGKQVMHSKRATTEMEHFPIHTNPTETASGAWAEYTGGPIVIKYFSNEK